MKDKKVPFITKLSDGPFIKGQVNSNVLMSDPVVLYQQGCVTPNYLSAVQCLAK